MAISSASFAYVRELLRRRSAISIEIVQAPIVESRLGPLARQDGCASIDEFVMRIRDGSGSGTVETRIVEAMATHETEFFRDRHPYAALETQVIPELIRTHSLSKTLRIWCGACSTGQEPYSIAMLLTDRFPVLADWTVRILATDLSSWAIEKAREGRYRTREVRRGLTPSLLEKHFLRTGDGWQISDHIRQMVELECLNIHDGDWPFVGSMDIVFLRNVLIYFGNEDKKAVLARVRNTLSWDGSLFLGGAETTHNIDDAFYKQTADDAVWFRKRRTK